MLTKSIRESGVCRALIHFPKGNLQNLSILKKKLDNFPTMESLDLASEISTKEIYCLKNNNKKKVNISQVTNKNFIAVIDFGVKRNKLKLLDNM